MAHPQIEKILTLRDRELTESERSELTRHLEICEECRGVIGRWDQLSFSFQQVCKPQASERFVGQVMQSLRTLEEPEEVTERVLLFPRWVWPALGYAFAFFLMFIAIAEREPLLNTGNVLLADVPQTAQWTFSTELPDLNQLVKVSPKEEM